MKQDTKTTLPELWVEVFKCPHCKVLTTHTWNNDSIFLKGLDDHHGKFLFNQRNGMGIFKESVTGEFLKSIKSFVKAEYPIRNFIISTCFNCKKNSIWVDEKMIYPISLRMDEPHTDMSDNIKEVYEEARHIEQHSPRAAAALLRLALELLLNELEVPKKRNLRERIEHLKDEKKLSNDVMVGMDSIRIIGNDSVHPGQIDFVNKDNEKIAGGLFRLINYIVEKTIYEPKQIKEIYAPLSEQKKVLSTPKQ